MEQSSSNKPPTFSHIQSYWERMNGGFYLSTVHTRILYCLRVSEECVTPVTPLKHIFGTGEFDWQLFILWPKCFLTALVYNNDKVCNRMWLLCVCRCMCLNRANREVNCQALSSNKTCSSSAILLPKQHSEEHSKTMLPLNKSKCPSSLAQWQNLTQPLNHRFSHFIFSCFIFCWIDSCDVSFKRRG